MADADNPLLTRWTAPYGLPPYEDIKPEHFAPAFDRALRDHLAEIDYIESDADAPAFANVIAALEKAGDLLNRVCSVFFGLTSAHTNSALQAIEREIAPRLANHFSAIYTRPALYARVEVVWEARTGANLTVEEERVLERYRRRFVNAGAALDAPSQARMSAIKARLAELTTRFSQNVLADEAETVMALDSADLAGLPEFAVAAAKQAAEEAGLPDKYLFTLSRSNVTTFLKFSARRNLRRRMFEAFQRRGANGGATDNRAVLAEIVRLRDERARLLGFASYAHFNLEDAMAKTPEAVEDLLQAVWTRALVKLGREREDLERVAREGGDGIDLQPWDWRYYAEKVRAAEYDLDEAALMPYFQLDAMIEAAFYVAGRLFSVRFEERFGLPSYHPDVRVWEVFNGAGETMGLFVGDYFARPSKAGGAWMRALRSQERVAGEVKPVIVNVANFPKPADGQPALLSVADAETLFHEFGHGLHGLLSNVTYPMVSGTNVPRDFVELPSQLYEHWLMAREVLEKFAVHAQTGAALSADLLQRLREARTFNQGFETVQYVASAIVDLKLHLHGMGDLSPVEFEIACLGDTEALRRVGLRHYLPHFLHLFAGDGYAAGYYSYLWSEIMDADAFTAFEETGDLFDAATAKRLHDHIFSTGGSVDPVAAYAAFRGRPPELAALFAKRGL